FLIKNGGGHFAPELGGHFELESGGHFKLELGGQYNWNLHDIAEEEYKIDIRKNSPPEQSTILDKKNSKQ
ncbi:hypothetical protein, partial [Flavobacterium sp. LB1P71]|uniref:hypothetical protein n=1 Tax=Flavobacterium sp. LB1P71 TaxID=3401716 RepID=UPI003AACB7A6